MICGYKWHAALLVFCQLVRPSLGLRMLVSSRIVPASCLSVLGPLVSSFSGHRPGLSLHLLQFTTLVALSAE